MIDYSLAAWVHPLFRCLCGHVLAGCDFDIDGGRVRLIRGHCHKELLAFTIRIIGSDEEYQR